MLTSDGQELAPLDRELASNVVGAIGQMTAAEATAHGARFDLGDPIGRGGLEKTMDATLAGVASGSIAIADASGHVQRELKAYAGKAGTDVKTTFDLAIQAAGERTLAAVTNPAGSSPSTQRPVPCRPSSTTPWRASRGRCWVPPTRLTFKIIDSTPR